MTEDAPPAWRRALDGALQLPPIAGAAAVLALLWTCFRARVVYPFDIEWMEGGMLAHAWRLREGLPLYAEPTWEWVPYIYPPLYPWLISLMGEPTYAAARALSMAGTLAAAAAAIYAVRRERAGWGFAFAAGGAFLSAYEHSGTFYDLVRNDAVAIGLGAWAMALCRVGTRRAVIAGGLFLVAAFTAKHNLAAVGLPILLWLWRYRGWRRAATFAASSVLPALAFMGAMQIATDGLFLVYLLEVPGGHPLVAERGWPNAESELWRFIPWINGAALVAALALLLARPAKRRWGLAVAALSSAGLLALGYVKALPQSLQDLVHAELDLLLRLLANFEGRIVAAGGEVPADPMDARWLAAIPLALGVLIPLLASFYGRSRWEGARYWLGIGLVMVPLVALMRAHHGGFKNVVMPGHWLVSVAACAMVGHAARRWSHPALVAALSGLVCWQLVDARWDPKGMLPTEDDVAAGEQVLEAIAAYEGDVLMPHFPWYPALVGKKPSFPLIALWDVNHKEGPLKKQAGRVRWGISKKKWDAAIMPQKDMGHALSKHYKKARRLKLGRGAMKTRTGWRVVPLWIWEPKAAAPEAPPE